MARRLIASKPHVLEVQEFDPAPLESDQIRVQTEYASGKHGTATAMFDSLNFQGQEFDLERRLFVETDENPDRFAKPMQMGTTATGTVTEVGSDVSAFKPGDNVLGLMKVASINTTTEENLWHLGDVDPLQGLCMEPAYVSIHSVRESQIRWGDSVAVIGLGAIGLISVAMAVGAGATTVIAVDPLENRRKWALSHGATQAFDPITQDVPGLIHEMTDGKGVDVAIEVSGKYQALETAIKSTRLYGTVCSSGFYQGEATSLWLGREWHHNMITAIVPHGCGWAHHPRDYPRWDTRRAYDAIVDMIGQGRLDLSGMINPLVSIDEMPDVFRRIEQDPGTVIKYGVKF